MSTVLTSNLVTIVAGLQLADRNDYGTDYDQQYTATRKHTSFTMPAKKHTELKGQESISLPLLSP